MIPGVVAGQMAHPKVTVAARYWRLYIDQTNAHDNTFAEVGYFEMMSTIGGSTIATGGTPSASSQGGSGTNGTAAGAFTGATTDRWYSANGQAEPSWLAYDFGASVIIRQIGIRYPYSPPSGGDAGRNAPALFRMQYSTDGSSWFDAASFDIRANPNFAFGERRTFTVQT